MEDITISTSIALLSSGLDSVTAVSLAREHTQVKLALVFDYGQRSAKREIEYAGKICDHFGIFLKVIDLPWLAGVTKTSLVNTASDVPVMSPEKISDDADPSITLESAKNVWVPNRNGALINIAASFAESMGCDHVIVGFNREEAATFPDNSTDFIEAINNSLSYSTLNKVKVLAPLIGLDKKGIVRKAIESRAPLEYSWSCYHGGEVPCGVCESCVRRQRAFDEAGIADPLLVKLGVNRGQKNR
ncbi:7-cyano-7-deazaguanine synthase QueC [Methanolobus chelungpuianus]|uniref:7-cyano-7-deazaguanine synthase n=1 Tax=Methanolobus chelungpuianus TaxID=502115 RepID=A0AAE3HAS2_9EURY|nr:7-cyano-7-deazaguanine synthase QueC [Methanolobus chelungpuianus]MCQ6962911.1 7-cyano-7-deazaguanine synthase [Methanolobus chelungpuianus]